MVLSTPRNEVEQQDKLIGTEEVFNLWNLLRHRYLVLDQLKILKNYVHDADFKHILSSHINRFERDLQILKKEAEKFSIKGPIPCVTDVNVMGNSEIFRDQDVGRILHEYLKTDLETFMIINRDSSTNDHLRTIFIKMMKQCMKALFSYVEYLKLKGWIETPPLYPYVQSDVEERIAANEIYQLWDHLTARYRNIRLTQVSANFAYDGDFKYLLTTGAKVLENQAKRIEEVLLHFGVPLPHRFSDVIPAPESTELLDDVTMYSVILSGMQDAVVLHGLALKDCVVNMRVRDLFQELLYDEIDIINKMLKYGKVKGWLPLTPGYRMS